MVIVREVINKEKLVDNYVIVVDLYFSAVRGTLRKFIYVNINWKYWSVCPTYSKRCHKEHTRVMDVLLHYDPWSLFIVVIVKQNIFTSLKKSYWNCTIIKGKYTYFTLLTISALNINRHKIKQTPNKGNVFVHISRWAYNDHIHTHKHIIRFNE
jgi:hypothetical protein